MKLIKLPTETVTEAEGLFRLNWSVEDVAKQLNISTEQARRIRQMLWARQTPAGSFPTRKKDESR